MNKNNKWLNKKYSNLKDNQKKIWHRFVGIHII